MPLWGKIIVIKRNGTDGTHFPLTANCCLFGRKKECDIRIQMPQVSKQHCKIEINENKEAVLFNLSSTNPTQLNGSSFQDPTFLKHGDILTIIDRAFRFEYPSHSFLQKRLSKSQEKETLQVLQMELICPQNSDCKSPPISGRRLESQALNSNEKRNQKQYRQCKPAKRELSPFSKLCELMKHQSGTGSTKEESGNETCTGRQQKRHLSDGNSNLLEDLFQSPIRESAVGQAKLTEDELSESTKIERKDSIASISIPKSFEDKLSEKSSNIQSYAIKQKQEYEDTGQSYFNVMEDNGAEKSEVIKSANSLAVFKESQSAPFLKTFYIASLDNTEKPRPLSEVNLKDTLISVENTLSKPNINRENDQTYSSPCSRNSRHFSKSRKSGVQIESIRMKCSEETKCTYSKINEIDKEMTAESTQNLKSSEDGNSSTTFISLNNSKSCNCNIEPNIDISNECSYMEVIDTKTSVLTLADPSKTDRIMPDEVLEKNLEPSWSTNDNRMKITTEGHEQSVEKKNNIPDFSSPYESIPTTAMDDAVSEMNLSCLLNDNKKSESKKSAQKRKGRELDTFIQPLGKRKRVSFGGQLSPELFDKHLPPNSPLKRGSIPARLSMPFGNSPRAVLKKTSELRKSVIKGISESNQHENIVSKQAAWPHTSSDASCSNPQRNECLSLPHVMNLSPEEKGDLAQKIHVSTEEKKTEFDEQKSKAVSSLRRSKTFTPRRTSIHKNIRAMDGICAKRRSGASEANLIVAKSWAEIVKQGVPKPQLKLASKQAVKRSVKKKPRKSLKNVFLLKTPRGMSSHFTTGHANSPAPIVIGKAYTGIVNIVSEIPKMEINYSLKEHYDFNESFTEKKSLLDLEIPSLQKLENQDVTSPVLKEEPQIFVPEQDGLKMTLKKASVSEEKSQVSPKETTIIGEEEENQQQASVPVKVFSGVKRLTRTPKQKTDLIEALSGVKRLMRTPKQKRESVDALSGVKRLMRTPKQKREPVDVCSGVKRLMRTPKQKTEPVDALSGVKRLLKTPKQKREPVDALSGVKRLMRTPKQKTEPVDALSGVKRLMRTPKQKTEPVDALSGVKRLMRTPKQKREPVDVCSGVKRLMRTPKQKTEPVDALSGVKRLMRTPKQKTELVDALSGVKRLMRTPKQKTELVDALSGVKRLLRTPKQKTEPVDALSEIQRLMRMPQQNEEAVVDDTCTKSVVSMQMLRAVTNRKKKQREQPMEGNRIAEEINETLKPLKDMESIQLKTQKEIFGPIDDIGSNQVLKQRRQTFPSTSDCVGLQEFVTGLKRSYSNPEMDCTGGKEMLDTAEEPKAELSESTNLMDDNGSWINSRKHDSMENVSEDCNAKLIVSSKRESLLPISRNSSNVPSNTNHAPFNEFKKESDEATTGTISLSGSYKPGGMDPNNESRFDFVKEPAANPDAVKTENLEPLALDRDRRAKTDNSNSVQCTEMVQRFIKNTHRTSSADFVKANEIFDRNIIEVCPVHKSESKILVVETKNKESQRERSKEYSVKTNGNIKSNNISHNQELKKPLKETAMEKQPRINRSRMAAKRNGQAEANIKENGPAEESEGHLIVRRSLRSKDGQNSKNDLNSKFTQDKISCETSGVKCIKRNRRGKAATRQTVLETLNTMLNEHKQGRQKCRVSILKTESSEDNSAEENDILARKGKRKKVHFSLQESNSELSEDQDNTHEDKSTYLSEVNSIFVQEKYTLEIQTEKIYNGSPKVPLDSMQAHAEHNLQGREKTAKENPPRRVRSKKRIFSPSIEFDNKPMCVVENHNITVTVKENQSKRGRGRKIALKPVALENITSGEQAPIINSFRSAEKRDPLPQIQNENDSEAQKMPLESVHILEKHISPDSEIEENPSRREKTTRENPPRRGRSKKAIHSPSVEFDNKPSSSTEDHNKIVTVKENQSKRGRRSKSAQKPVALENITFGEEVPITNSFISVQKTGSLPQVQNKDVREIQKMLLESVHILEKHIPPDSVIEENPPRREKTAKENPRRGRSKKAIPSPSKEFDSKPSSSAEDHNKIVTVKENQSKRGRRSKSAQKPVALENITFGEEVPITNSFISVQKTGSLPQVQNKDVREIQKMPLESVHILKKHIPPDSVIEENPPRREKTAKENPRRGRSKKAIPSSSKEFDNKPSSSAEDHNKIVTVKENQSKRSRGRKTAQNSLAMENITTGEEVPIMNSFISVEKTGFLPQIQNENVREAQKMSLESLHILEKQLSPDNIIEENPPRRGRDKQVCSGELSNKQEADIKEPNMILIQEDYQSKRGRGKRIVVFQVPLPLENVTVSKGNSIMNNGNDSLQYAQNEENPNTTNGLLNNEQTIAESTSKKCQSIERENPLRRSKRKKHISCEVATEYNSEEITNIEDYNIVNKNSCSGKESQMKMNRGKKIASISQELLKNTTIPFPLLKGEHSSEQPNVALGAASNANENFSHKCSKRKTDYDVSTSSYSSTNSFKLLDNYIQEKQLKDIEAVENQKITRNKRKQLMSDETSTESNGQLGTDSKKTKLVKVNVDPSGNSFEKMNLSKRRREETVNASLVSPSLKVSITLSPLSLDKSEATNENQNGSTKHTGVYNIMTRSIRGKCMQPKEKILHGNQNKDLEETAMVHENIHRRGRRKVNKPEAAITSLKEKCILSSGNVISIKNEVIILNEKVSDKEDSLMVKKKKFQDMKNTDRSTSSSYDQNKNLDHLNLLKQNRSSRRGKWKQINGDSETNASIGKENESTVTKTENPKRMNKKKIKENTTSGTNFSGETEGRTRASKRTKK